MRHATATPDSTAVRTALGVRCIWKSTVSARPEDRVGLHLAAPDADYASGPT
jgi:hypothetical protein